jgi:hypothetical protein
MTDTTDANVAEWEKELKVLLGIIQDHPSRDLTVERERVVLLNKLIASHGAKQDA